MTAVTFDGNAVVMRDNRVGTGPECCCCCITGTNCTVTVTVTYSNGQVRTNGEDMLNADGNAIDDTPIMPYFAGCNLIAFSHEIINDIACYQGASKQQQITCDICCDTGIGCDCSLSQVTVEDYSFNPNDPGGVCDQTPDINYVTSIAFSLTDCGECPCNEFP